MMAVCLFGLWAGIHPFTSPPPLQVLHLLSGLKSKSSEICIITNAPSKSSNTNISSPKRINSKTNLPWLVRGEYCSNTPWLFTQVFLKPYSSMPCQWWFYARINLKIGSSDRTLAKYFRYK